MKHKYKDNPLYEILVHTRAQKLFCDYGLPLFSAKYAWNCYTYSYLYRLYRWLPYSIENSVKAIAIIHADVAFRDSISTLHGLDPKWIETNIEDIVLKLEKDGFKAKKLECSC